MKIVAACIRENKGEQKTPVEQAVLSESHGIVGYAHAGDWHRQVSLLPKEPASIRCAIGRDDDNGDFCENMTTEGINL